MWGSLISAGIVSVLSLHYDEPFHDKGLITAADAMELIAG